MEGVVTCCDTFTVPWKLITLSLQKGNFVKEVSFMQRCVNTDRNIYITFQRMF